LEDGVLSFTRVARDAALLYMYGHVPIVLYLIWYQITNGSLENAWQFGLNAPKGKPAQKTGRRARTPNMMAGKKKPVEQPTKGFISEQGSASYYFTWTVALSIYALMFYGIAQKAAERGGA
jgi:hypothetical protein